MVSDTGLTCVLVLNRPVAGVGYLLQVDYAPRYMAYAEVVPDASPLSYREGWALRIREAVNRGQVRGRY